MNLSRIQREFYEAKQQFSYVELHPTSDGNVYVKAALQAAQQLYVVSISFSSIYPNDMPKVYIEKPKITTKPSHFYESGNICYLHPKMWNPGVHDLLFVIARTTKWLNKYEVWKSTGNWPGASIEH